MKKFAAVTVPLLLLTVASTAGAQSLSSGWTSYRAQQKAATAPTAQAEQAPAASAYPAQTPAQPQSGAPAQAAASQWYPAAPEQPRGGFFVGAQAGAGWVFEDIDQRVLGVNAGYRWQAGPDVQVGVEVAASRLEDTTWRGEEVPSFDFVSIGGNARFNFGRNSPWFGIARGGYWYAESDDWFGESVDIDGAYAGLGIGVDINRNFNLQLMYTAYLYSYRYYYDDNEFEVNRADVLTLGGEVRF
ncbi:outer membrane beta-barrel protein [Stenotrophomonas sp. SY1]|uniref:outer membrane beta-barrel protein n=1 Tax=Stenotrophomonas sp. SY1 TaxID=477235 RepID=UPI001E4377C6|nr:outer membrane beta-barrel protein [Stenotrophomonas sp. SY1]MCD9088490.1 outer membrane beta-barrel protein [Stenotrophomonas sp. SY1]